MKDERREHAPVVGREALEVRRGPARPYQPPLIVKRRAVSRATLFSGTGPDSGGVVSQ